MDGRGPPARPSPTWWTSSRRTFRVASRSFEEAAEATLRYAGALHDAKYEAGKATALLQQAGAQQVPRDGGTPAAARALAVRHLREAAELAPRAPSLLSRALGQGKEFLRGVTSFVGELVDTVKAFLDDPGAWIKGTWDAVYSLVAVWNFDQFTSSWKEFGRAFVAWDEWADNPARALGKVVFNVGTLVVGGGAVRQVVKRGMKGAPEAAVKKALRKHPNVTGVDGRLMADKKHRLNLTRDLDNPARRARTLALLNEMARGKVLGNQSLDDFLERNPGAGPLFEPVARDVNVDASGRSRKQGFVDDAKERDPARAVTSGADPQSRALVEDYAERLIDSVEPYVAEELRDLIGTWPGDPDSASVSSRTKTGPGILDKVERMTTGTGGRASRPDHAVGDVIDAVGARITVENTEPLGSADVIRRMTEETVALEHLESRGTR